MHCLLKHKILQFVFKCFTYPLHVSVPLDHLQGAHIRTLLKLLKLQFLLKYQLKHLVKIVVGGGGGGGGGGGVWGWGGGWWGGGGGWGGFLGVLGGGGDRNAAAGDVDHS
jgi:hypothetical protein